MALLPFFVSNPANFDEEYFFDMISGQIVYKLNVITKELGSDDPHTKAHRLNIGFYLFPRLFAVAVMVLSSVAVAVKLLLYRAPSRSSDSNKNTQRNTSITLLILAVIFFLTYVPFAFVQIVDVGNWYDALNLTKGIFYLAPSCYMVAYLSSAINPLVYQLRGRSIFEKKKRTGTVYVNQVSRQETRLSVVDESKL